MPPRTSGFTLFEMLVSLAILAAVLGITATALRPPSPALLLDRQMADLANDIALARDRATRSGKPTALPLPDCEGAETEALFFPNGTARATDICLTQDALTRRLSLDPLTGRLTTPLIGGER